MRLTLAQMEALYWTARLGSVVAAAARLGLTQPSVSLRLKDLRYATGIEPFERGRTGQKLTPEGHRLLEQVSDVLERVETIGSGVHGDIDGPLRLGLAEGFAVVCLPRLLPELTRAYPALHPELTVATTVELEAHLLAGRLDLAIMVNPVGSGLDTLPLGTHITQWVAGPGWDLPEPVRPADLAELPIIVNPPSSTMHRRMMDWFATAAIRPSHVSICSSGAIALQLVAAGLGLSLAPTNMVRAYPQPGLLRVLVSEPVVEPGHVYIGRRSGSDSRTLDCVCTMIARLVPALGHLQVAEIAPD